MSTQTRNLDYGVRTFDLSQQRDNERFAVKGRHLSILRCDAPATLRLGSPQASGVPARNIESITLPNDVENIYLSNPSNSGELVILQGIAGTEASVPSPDNDVNLTSDSTREVGKVRVLNSSGVLENPATEETLSSLEGKAATASQFSNQSGVNYGQQSVASAGTAEALNGGTSLSVPDAASLTVRAEVDSSGDHVYVGDSGVSASDGFKLADGEGVTLDVDDVSTVHVDADTAGDGVSWIVEG